MDADDTLIDAEDLALRRARLRAQADRFLSALEGMPLPETFIEAERSARATMAMDRLMGQLYGAPMRPAPPNPTTLREPSGAPRATASRRQADDFDDEDDPHAGHEDDLDYWKNILAEKLDHLAASKARYAPKPYGDTAEPIPEPEDDSWLDAYILAGTTLYRPP